MSDFTPKERESQTRIVIPKLDVKPPKLVIHKDGMTDEERAKFRSVPWFAGGPPLRGKKSNL